MIDKLSYHLTNIKDFILYDIPRGIKNLVQWFPIIWTDRNWDYYFIYKILHKKLDLTEKHIRSNDNHTNSQKDADKIKECVLLLERLLKDDYHENAFIAHTKKWGEAELVFSDVENNPDLQSIDVIYKTVKTPEDKKKQYKDFKRAMTHWEYLKRQDVDRLFDIMKRNIQTWWD